MTPKDCGRALKTLTRVFSHVKLLLSLDEVTDKTSSKLRSKSVRLESYSKGLSLVGVVM
jgi:hypothetical protein